MDTMDADIHVFRVGTEWNFELGFGTDDQIRIWRTRYARLFATRRLALQAAASHLDFLAESATLYELPENNGWSWELWLPAHTDEPGIIIEPVGLDPATSFGAAQGSGLRWAQQLGLEIW
jgi:hypothetical protein